MNQFLYKGFIALDDFTNDAKKKKQEQQQKKKDDYLITYKKDLEDEEKEKKLGPYDELKAQLQSYKFNMPKKSITSSTKFFNSSKNLAGYLTGNYFTMMNPETFEGAYLLETPQFLWKTEQLEDLGDIVLLFPNPDSKQAQHIPKTAENGISFDSAMHQFESIFEVSNNFEFKKQFGSSLREAFGKAFVNLEEFVPLNAKQRDQYLKKQKIEQEKLTKEMQAKKKALKEEAKKRKTREKQKKKRAKNDKTAAEISEVEKKKEPEKSESGFAPSKSSGKNKEIKKNILQEEKESVDSSSESSNDDNDKLGDSEEGQTDSFTKKGTSEAPTKEPQVDKIESEGLFEIEKQKMRKVWGGQFYLEPHKDSPSKYYWIKNPNQPEVKDFMTLLRHTVLAALANQGFIIRQFFCNEGKHIAAVLTLAEPNLKKLAKEIQLTKSVEFGMADILSLEPVDNKGRPLRMNLYIRDENMWEKTYLVEKDPLDAMDLNKIRKTILNLLQNECNMKAIVRMCGGTWSENTEDFENDIYDHDIIPIDLWLQYKDFLVLLACHINEINKLKKKISFVIEKYHSLGKIGAKGNKDTRQVDRTEMNRLVNRLTVRAFQRALEEAGGGKDKSGKPKKPAKRSKSKGHKKPADKKESLGSKYDKNAKYPGNNLKTIWDILETDPIDYSFPYQAATNRMRPRNRRKMELVWQDRYYHYPHTQQSISSSSPSSPPLMDPEILSLISSRIKDLKGEGQGEDLTMTHLKGVEGLFGGQAEIREGGDFGEEGGEEKKKEETLPLTIRHYLFTNRERLLLSLHLLEKVVNLKNMKKVNRKMQLKMEDKLTSRLSGFLKTTGINEVIFGGNQIDDVIITLHNKRELLGEDTSDQFASIFKFKSIYDNLVSDRLKITFQYESKGKKSRPEPKLVKEASGLGTRGGTANCCQPSQPHEEDLHQIDVQKVKVSFQNDNDEAMSKFSKSGRGAPSGQELGPKSAVNEYDKGNLLRPACNQKISMTLNPEGKHRVSKESLDFPKSHTMTSVDLKNIRWEQFLKLLNAEIIMIDKIEDSNNRIYRQARKFEEHSGKLEEELLERSNLDSLIDFDEFMFKTSKKTSKEYSLDNSSLLKSVLESLHTNYNLRDHLIKNFKNLTIFDLKSPAHLSLQYPLSDSFKLTFFRNQAQLPEATLRDYFGEKIALYFSFVSYYKDRLVTVSIIGILYSILIIFAYIVRSREDTKVNKTLLNVYEAVIGFFSIFVVFWARSFVKNWAVYEKVFAVKYGQTNLKAAKEVRSSFKGVYKRNLVDDSLNSYEENSKRSKNKQKVTVFVFLIMAFLSVLSAYYLLKGKRNFVRQAQSKKICTDCKAHCPPKSVDCVVCEVKNCVFERDDDGFIMKKYTTDSNGQEIVDEKGNQYPVPKDNSYIGAFELNEVFFNVLEFFRIKLMQQVSLKIVINLINWQNMKYKKDHEKQIILYLGLLSLVNNCAVIFIVSIQYLRAPIVERIQDGETFHTTVSSQCIGSSCSQELSMFFFVFCVMQVVWLVFYEFIIQIIAKKIYLLGKKILINYVLKKTLAILIKKKVKEQEEAQKDFKRLETEQENKDKVAMAEGALALQFNLISSLKKKEVSEVAESNLAETFSQERLDFTKGIQELKIQRLIKLHYLRPWKLYDKVNKNIDQQITQLESDSASDGIDKELTDYLALFNNFTYTALFGTLFPISFATTWILSVLENYFDRRSLLSERYRPIPIAVNTIGLWLKMFKAVSMLALWTNSYYISFLLLENHSSKTKFYYFIFLTTFFSIVTYFIYDTEDPQLKDKFDIFCKRTEFVKTFLFTPPKLSSVQNESKIAKAIVQFSNMIFFSRPPPPRNNDTQKIARQAVEEIQDNDRTEKEMKLMKQCFKANKQEFKAQAGANEPSGQGSHLINSSNNPNFLQVERENLIPPSNATSHISES